MKDDVHIAMYSDLRGIMIYQMLNVEGMDQTSFVQACAAGEFIVWVCAHTPDPGVCLELSSFIPALERQAIVDCNTSRFNWRCSLN